MPIPFRDADDVEELGAAAFLKVERLADGSGYLGALFSMDARGEPLEFTYNRIEVPHSFLWRPADLKRHADRRLTASLLRRCSVTPRLLLCLADEVGSELFGRDILVEVPVGRIGQPLPAIESASGSDDAGPEPPHLFWQPGAPAEDSIERRLFDRLSAHGLLLEPFERATFGLREVYADRPGAQRPGPNRPGSGAER